MRLAAMILISLAFGMIAPSSASAEVVNCSGHEALGMLTCSTTGPSMIDGSSFVGDGSSSAQLQWVGQLTATAPGTLTLTYTYSGIFNTLFANLGIRLTVSQPACEEPFESERDWIDPATMDGAPEQVSVPVSCAGPLEYKITSRAATYSTGGSFVGDLVQTDLTFHPGTQYGPAAARPHEVPAGGAG